VGKEDICPKNAQTDQAFQETSKVKGINNDKETKTSEEDRSLLEHDVKGNLPKERRGQFKKHEPIYELL
jgi:ribosomal protein L13